MTHDDCSLSDPHGLAAPISMQTLIQVYGSVENITKILPTLPKRLGALVKMAATEENAGDPAARILNWHSLKGVARQVGADDLAKASALCESMARETGQVTQDAVQQVVKEHRRIEILLSDPQAIQNLIDIQLLASPNMHARGL